MFQTNRKKFDSLSSMQMARVIQTFRMCKTCPAKKLCKFYKKDGPKHLSLCGYAIEKWLESELVSTSMARLLLPK